MFQYILDVTKFNLAFCLVCLVFINPFMVAMVFGTIGTFVGLIGFRQFHGNEYYAYHNLGFTTRELILKTWAVNALLALPLMGLGSLIAMIF